jgi:hypothetical protein
VWSPRLCSRLVLSAALFTSAPRVALAETSSERAAARAAAESGADAFEQGQYVRSLEMFSRAEQLVHAPPHLLFIARSLEKLGRLVEAREAYLKIVNEQLPPKAPSAFRSAQTKAEQELTAIEPRLAQVTVNVSGPDASSAAISMDRTDLPPAAAAIPMPADPGRHVFYAHTERAKSPEITITLREGAKEAVHLVVPEVPAGAETRARSGAAAGTTAPNQATVSNDAKDAGDEAPAAHGSAGTGQRIVGYSLLGLGVVGAGVGTFFLVSSLDKRDQADQVFACDTTPQGCSDTERGKIDRLDADAKKATTFAIVGYAAGGAMLATGLVLLLTADSSPPADSASIARSLHVTPGWRSVEVSGRF